MSYYDDIRKAQKEGKSIYYLDTNGFGEDTYLISDNYKDALSDVLSYYDIEELPEDWSLDLVDYNIYVGTSINLI